MDLFDHSAEKDTRNVPLADRMRPTGLQEVVGQVHLLAPDKLLGRAIASDRVPSMVLWGPPGTGKTTLARVVAAETKARFVTLSAVLSGVAELRAAVKEAREEKRMYGRPTILFVDEIHRFNKGQQDALLPHVENGTVCLIGATTENPSFAVNAALLSRTRVFELKPLDEQDLLGLLQRALDDETRGLGQEGLKAEPDCLQYIARYSRGDARRALSVLETAAVHASGDGLRLSLESVKQALASGTLLYDKSGEEHYNVVSAFIKSLRGSDPDGALYWMMRMLQAGEEPLFVMRRMLVFASEDIGNADPRALELAVASDQAFQRLGMPEGMHPMAQCCTYLASAPKSNASYKAWKAARQDVSEHGALEVPLRLRNAATSHMKAWGYGEDYRYPHDEGGYSEGETYLPDDLGKRRYYEPTQMGFEARIRERLQRLRGEDDQSS